MAARDFYPHEVAAIVLDDVTEQADLLESQLATVTSKLASVKPGTANHLALAQQAVTQQAELNQLRVKQAEIRESLKTELEKFEEQQQQAQAQAARLAARTEQAELTAAEVADAINGASDALAAALALAAGTLPDLADDLERGDSYRLAGPWRIILPSVAGNGKIGGLPYVIADGGALLLTTRQAAGGGRHLG